MAGYDAGAIEGSARLNKDPFLEGLRQCLRAGEEFEARRFTATADIDAGPAERAIDRVVAKGDNLSRRKFSTRIDVDTSGNVRFDALIRKAEKFSGTTYKAKVVLDAEIAFLKLDDIEARLAALGGGKTIHTVEIRYRQGSMPGLPSTRTAPGGAGAGGDAAGIRSFEQLMGDARQQQGGGSGRFSPLGAAAVGLVPALLPLLPLAGSLVGALGMVGVSGMLAFKGITNAEKETTQNAQAFRDGIASGKRDLTELEATAARHVLAPFTRDVSLLNKEMPFLNVEVGKYASVLGNTTSQLFEGSLRSLHVLDPLLGQVSGWVYGIASGFNRWTAGGGLERFEQRAMQVLPVVEKDLGDIVSAIVNVTRAATPFGMVSLRALDMVSEGINALPLPVLKTLVTLAATGYLAFQAWRGLAPVIGTVKTLTVALKAYEAQQLMTMGVTREVALANSSAAGGAAALAGRYGGLIGTLGLMTVAAGGLFLGWNKVSAAFRTTPESAAAAEKSMLDIATGAATLQSQLRALGDSGKDLHSDLENAFNESNWTKIKDFSFGLGTPFDTATSKSKAFFRTTDEGLSRLATSGQAPAAAAAFKAISDEAALQGITVDQLLTKLPKYKAALDQVAATSSGPLKGVNGVLMATSGSLDQTAARWHLNAQQAQGYASILGVTSDQVKNASVTQLMLAQSVDVVNVAELKATATTSEYIDAVNTFAQSAGTAADRAALIIATLKAGNGDALAYANTMVAAASANQQLVSGMDKQTRAAINLKTGVIDYRNAAAGPLLSSLQNLQTAALNAAGATYQHEVATKGAKAASDDAVTAYYAQTHGALMDEARQLGLTKDQAKRLADQYFSLPKDIRTKIEAIGTDPVLKVLDQIGQQLSILTHRPWVSQFSLNGGSGALATVVALQERLVSLNGKNIYVQVNERTVGGSASGGRQVISAYGNIVKQYGYGGFDDVPNNHQPAIYPVRPDGRARVFAEPETHGEVYAPLANDHRRPRAQAIIARAAQIMGGIAYFANGGGFGFVNVQGPTAAKAKSGSGSGRSGSSSAPGAIFNGKLYSSYQAAEAAKASLGDSLVKALGGELAGLPKLANATASAVSSALARVTKSIQSASSAGLAPSGLVAWMRRETVQLTAEVARRDMLASHLANTRKTITGLQATMATKQSDVASSIMGGFDIATAGNGYASGISATLDQQVADAKKFAALGDKARALGLNSTLVDQLLSKGPAAAGANLEAIVNAGTASKGYIEHLNSQYDALDTAAQAAGKSDANALYGAQLASLQATAAREAAAQLAEQRAMNKTLSALAAQVRSLESTVARQAQEAHQLALARARSNGARPI